MLREGEPQASESKLHLVQCLCEGLENVLKLITVPSTWLYKSPENHLCFKLENGMVCEFRSQQSSITCGYTHTHIHTNTHNYIQKDVGKEKKTLKEWH